MAKRKKNRAVPEKDTLIRDIVIFLAALVIADLLVILYFNWQPAPGRSGTAGNTIMDIAAEEYKNQESGKMDTLKTGGEFDRKMPVFKEKLKFKLGYDPVLAGPNGLHVLSVCCPAGYSKEFYTAKMPWAFYMYEFEPGLPTVVLFDIDKNAKKGRFEIVILDKLAEESAIKAVSVTIFVELLKQYMPGIEWEGNVRKEIM